MKKTRPYTQQPLSQGSTELGGGRGSSELGRGSNEYARGSNELGRGSKGQLHTKNKSVTN